jgi:hypothetical protein
MDAYSTFVDELRDEQKLKENRIRVLEHSILSLLLNPNLYEFFQNAFLRKLNECPTLTEDALYTTIFEDEREKEYFLGPEEIYTEILEANMKGLKKKMLSYRKTGNLNS